MYPMKLSGTLKHKIWGGRNLSHFNKSLPQGKIGESWEVACHENGSSVIQNGVYEGLSLCQVMTLEGQELMGELKDLDRFPLLVKFIDAHENLSVQVHPNDTYSFLVEGQPGKTELWYVLEAEEGAEIILGLKKSCSIQETMNKLEEGDVNTCLKHIQVKTGDVFYIPSGTIHGIGEGVVILEIQQNSDVTYRLYDYGRGRELALNKAMDVIDTNAHTKHCEDNKKDFGGFEKNSYVLTPYFAVEKLKIHTVYYGYSNQQFNLLTCIEGHGIIESQHGTLTIRKGETVIIPASIDKYKCIGKLELVRSYVPQMH